MEHDRLEARYGVSGKPAVVIAGGGAGSRRGRAGAAFGSSASGVAIELVAPGDELVYGPRPRSSELGPKRGAGCRWRSSPATHAVRHRRAADGGRPAARQSRSATAAAWPTTRVVATGARALAGRRGVFGGAGDVHAAGSCSGASSAATCVTCCRRRRDGVARPYDLAQHGELGGGAGSRSCG